MVVGGGLTGFSAAIEAAQLGQKTAIIEEHALGGGDPDSEIVPIHYLLQNAKVVRRCSEAKNRGLKFGKVSLNFEALYEAYQEKNEKLTNILINALKSKDVDIFIGTAIMRTDHTIAIRRSDYKTRFIKGDKVILAGGVTPDLPAMFEAVPQIMNDRTVGLSGYLPRSIAMYGYGPKICEAAQIFAIFGSRVTVLVSEKDILPGYSEKMNDEMDKLLESYHVTIRKNIRIENLYRDSAFNYHLDYKNREKTDKHTLTVEEVYYSGAQRASFRGLDALSLSTADGWIETNAQFETTSEGVYAPCGSRITEGVSAGMAEAARIAVRAACGKETEDYNPDLIPHLIQTIPEASRIGLEPRQAAKAGFEVQTGEFPLSLNDWAIMLDGTEGFVRITSDTRYGEILGAEAFGRGAAEITTTAQAVMRLEGTVEDLAEIVYPYPSVSEVLGEAAMDALGKSAKKPVH